MYMQLFVTDFQRSWTTIHIENADILSQLRNVLRVRLWDHIEIQSPAHEEEKMRYEIRIDTREKSVLEWTIVSETTHASSSPTESMIIAMPNKRDKIEIIVQKLTECGLDEIIFRPSERSVIKTWNPNKEERLHKIIREAVEQSKWRQIPRLRFAPDIRDILKDAEVVIFDIITDEETHEKSWKSEKQGSFKVKGLRAKVWIVGPEWWLSPKDYDLLESYAPKAISLWSTILRTETAAIIWWWLLKHNW